MEIIAFVSGVGAVQVSDAQVHALITGEGSASGAVTRAMVDADITRCPVADVRERMKEVCSCV